MQKWNAWKETHPLLFAIGSLIVMIGAGMIFISGIWSGFSSKPVFPYIFSQISSHGWRVILLIIFAAIFCCGIWLLIDTWRSSKSVKQAPSTELDAGKVDVLKTETVRTANNITNMPSSNIDSPPSSLYEVIQENRDIEQKILVKFRQHYKEKWEDRRMLWGNRSVPLVTSIRNANAAFEEIRANDKDLDSAKARLRVMMGQIQGPKLVLLHGAWVEESQYRQREYAREIYVAVQLYSYNKKDEEQEQLEHELAQMRQTLQGMEDATNNIISEIGTKQDLYTQETETIEGEQQFPLSISPPEIQFISESGDHIASLKVKNISDTPISDAYGKITSSKSIPSRSGRRGAMAPIPPKSNLAWQEDGQFAQTIPVGSPCHLVIAKRLRAWPDNQIYFETATERKAITLITPLVLDIEIGSKTANFRPQVVQVKLFWVSANTLEAELVNANPSTSRKGEPSDQ